MNAGARADILITGYRLEKKQLRFVLSGESLSFPQPVVHSAQSVELQRLCLRLDSAACFVSEAGSSGRRTRTNTHVVGLPSVARCAGFPVDRGLRDSTVSRIQLYGDSIFFRALRDRIRIHLAGPDKPLLRSAIVEMLRSLDFWQDNSDRVGRIIRKYARQRIDHAEQ